MFRPLQMLKHYQFREVGAFASLPPISQKSEMSSSQRRLKSFCTQLYQRHEKTSRREENLVATADVFFWVESPGSGVSSMGGKWVWRGWSEPGKTDSRHGASLQGSLWFSSYLVPRWWRFLRLSLSVLKEQNEEPGESD